eukprot:5030757-Amphidinium_carterae.1
MAACLLPVQVNSPLQTRCRRLVDVTRHRECLESILTAAILMSWNKRQDASPRMLAEVYAGWIAHGTRWELPHHVSWSTG